MNRLKFIIPNMFTAFSLISALTALNFIFENRFETAAWLIILSMVFDFLDGKMARLLKAFSSFGALFDTFSDFLDFGIVPAVLFYRISLKSIPVLGFVCFVIYIVAGCFRLVRFTLNNRPAAQKKPFVGLPIPAAAGLIVAFVLLKTSSGFHITDLVFAIVVLSSSFLMVSKIQYIALDKGKKIELIFLSIAAFLSVIFAFYYPIFVISFWILLYISYGVIKHLYFVLFNQKK